MNEQTTQVNPLKLGTTGGENNQPNSLEDRPQIQTPTSVIEQVELEVPPPSHQLPLPLLLAEGLAAAALGQGQEARHEPQSDVPNEGFDVLETKQNGTDAGSGSLLCGGLLVLVLEGG